MSNNNDKFWLHDPSILFRDFMYFIPTKNMTLNQAHNAVTRFCIYFIIISIALKKNKSWIYIPSFIIIIILVLSMIGQKYKTSIEKFDNVVEPGFIDSDGLLQFKRTTNAQKEPLENDLSYTCRKPTNANPFMNPSVADYNTPAPAACNAFDDEINDDIKRTFSHDLFMDVDDVFEKANSQRQFYTVPNTSIPNDQENFMNWLYRSPSTCKESQDQCLRYEDLRFKR